MITEPIGLYIHIPFCVRKCNYCDFCSTAPAEGMIERYVERLKKEISLYRRVRRIPVDTVYFGGGTPSILQPDTFANIVGMVRDTFEILPNAEFTVEVNPGTLERQKVERFRAEGVNRISIGLQSIHDNEMKLLGRIHNYSDFLHSYSMLRDAGFDNISFDLMYGIPEQTKESFAQTVESVLSLSPEHLSVYGLILEEGTPFYGKRDSLRLPDEDTECDMYRYACDVLRSHGYSHYEISNFAKPGFESRHNLKYWRAKEYIGIGSAAYSYFDGVRYGNTPDLERIDLAYREEIDAEAERFEYAMMRLRLSEGISLSEYRDRFGVDFIEGSRSDIDEYIRLGFMSLESDRLAFTESGFYVSNSILANIL